MLSNSCFETTLFSIPLVIVSQCYFVFRLAKIGRIVFLFLSLPTVFFFVTAFISHINKLEERPVQLEEILQTTLKYWSKQMNLIEQYSDIGLWTWKVMSLALLPLWTLLASVTF